MKTGIKTILACVAFFIILAIKYISIFYPNARLWGMNQLAYFSHKFDIISLVLISVFVILIAGWPKLKSLNIIAVKFTAFARKLPRFFLLISGLVFMLGLFHIFRDKSNLLGDSILRISELDRFHNVPATEPLDYLIHYFSYNYIFKTFGLSILNCFQLYSYLSGLLYIWAAWLVAKKLKKIEGFNLSLTFFYLLGWGGLMMFFGYAENYAFASVILLFFYYYSIEYIHSAKGLAFLVGTFLLAFFMHNLVIFMLPSLIYLLFINLRKSRLRTIASIFISLSAILAWIVFSYGGKESSAFLLTYSSSVQGYLLCSKAHFLDVLNELFLISPAFFILIWFQCTNYKKVRSRLRIFFWLAAIFGLLVLLFLDPKLGMARDWDLFAMPVLSLHLALFLNADWEKTSRFVKSAIIVIPVAFTAIWVLLNSNERLSIKRYLDIVELDTERSQYGYEVLAIYYKKSERWLEAEQTYYKSLRVNLHPRTLMNLGYAQMRLGKVIQAEKNLKKALEMEPRIRWARKYLGMIYLATNRLELARVNLNQYIQTPDGRNDEEAHEALKKLEEMLSEN